MVEGVIGPWMLTVVADPFLAAGLEAYYVVLRPTLQICLERAKARADDIPRVDAHPPLSDSGPIRDLAAQMEDLGVYEQHAFDTTGLDLATAVAVLAGHLTEGHFRLRSTWFERPV